MDPQHQKLGAKIKILPTIFLSLFFAGLTLILIGVYLNYRKTILSFSQAPPPAETVSKEEKKYYSPVNIEISDIGLDLEVKEANIINGVWEISASSASFLITSAKPGEGGNVVIYGHNKKEIFGPLIGGVKVGQEIKLKTQDGEEFSYQVSEIKTVTPEEIGVVLPTDYEVLTVYTCTGFMDSKRLIIKAYPTL